MSKIALLFLIFTSFWANSFAQKEVHSVYLKNGSIFKGKILLNTSDSLKIETCCKNILVFSPADVLRIEIEKLNSEKRNNQSAIDPLTKNGFYNFSTIGIIIGKSEVMDATGYSFRTIIGYEFNSLTALGLGTGIEKFNVEIVPFFISIKSEILKRENTPSVNFFFGYSLPLKKEIKEEYNKFNYEGGICAGFDVGILSYKTQKRAFSISAGYQFQHVTERKTMDYWYNNAIETNKYDFNKITVKIGYIFK
jgi:hypothetical protein